MQAPFSLTLALYFVASAAARSWRTSKYPDQVGGQSRRGSVLPLVEQFRGADGGRGRAAIGLPRRASPPKAPSYIPGCSSGFSTGMKIRRWSNPWWCHDFLVVVPLRGCWLKKLVEAQQEPDGEVGIPVKNKGVGAGSLGQAFVDIQPRGHFLVSGLVRPCRL